MQFLFFFFFWNQEASSIVSCRKEGMSSFGLISSCKASSLPYNHFQIISTVLFKCRFKLRNRDQMLFFLFHTFEDWKVSVFLAGLTSLNSESSYVLGNGKETCVGILLGVVWILDFLASVYMLGIWHSEAKTIIYTPGFWNTGSIMLIT